MIQHPTHFSVAILIVLTACGSREETVLEKGWEPVCSNAPGPDWTEDATLERVIGTGTEDWLEEVFGVASVNGSVWILDRGRGLLRIGEDGVVSNVASHGAGPGELRLSQVFGGDWVAVSGRSVVVYDGRRFSWFSSEGEFLDGVEGVDGVDPFQTDRIAPSLRGIWAGTMRTTDETGARELLLTEIGRTGRLRSIGVPLPPLPRVDGAPVPIVPRQAKASWHAFENCLYVTDGAQLLIRILVDQDRWDTLRLPERDLPALGEEDEQLLREAAAYSSISLSAWRSAEPTLVARWSDLRVDPNGDVWLKRWESRAAEDQEDWALRIEGNGEASDHPIGHFPSAFGEAGRLLSIGMDEATGAPLVQISRTIDH